MSGRSHRHRVPAARPPAGALGVMYLWGRGNIGSALHEYLHRERVEIDDRDDVARKLANDHGCPAGVLNEAWAWRISGADSRTVDELTADDPAVMGWTQNQREGCEPSVALRNTLNAVTKEEIPNVSEFIEGRFAKPGHAHDRNDPERWLAKDDRVVYYDTERQEWRLGEYAGT